MTSMRRRTMRIETGAPAPAARLIASLTLAFCVTLAWSGIARAATTQVALAGSAEEALTASVRQALGASAAEASTGTLLLAAAPSAGQDPAAAQPSSAWSSVLREDAVLLAQASTPDTTSLEPDPGPISGDGTFIEPKRPALAVGMMVGVDVAVWSFNRFIRDGGQDHEFRVGLQSWKNNYLNGFNWDDNSFSTNQFGHPYQGSLTYNAGRANGFGFFESYAFTWGGSFLWEYMGEANYPALNDWINTSMGGAAFGEALFRLSSMITDNTQSGSKRFWKELGGTAVNPIRGITRLSTGEWSKVQPNPPDRLPKSHQMIWRFGARTEGEDNLWTADTTHAFIELAAGYGDPFLGEYKKPFDTFDFGLQINFKDNSKIGRVQAKGLLFATPYSRSENTQTLIGAWQYYDYVNNSAFVYGAEKIGASFMSLRKPGKDFEARTHIDLMAIVLGATNSAYASISGRSYDYGPGLGVAMGGEFRYKGHAFFSLSQELDYIHTLNGTLSNHILSETQIAIDIPLVSAWTLNASYNLYIAQGNYEDFPDVYQRTPILRTALSWHHRR